MINNLIITTNADKIKYILIISENKFVISK